MGIFDFLKAGGSASDLSRLFAEVMKKMQASDNDPEYIVMNSPLFQILRDANTQERSQLIAGICEHARALAANDKRDYGALKAVSLINVIITQFNLEEDDIKQIGLVLGFFRSQFGFPIEFSIKTFIVKTKKVITAQGLTPPLREALEALLHHSPNEYREDKKVNEQVELLLQDDKEVTVNVHDTWGKGVSVFLSSLTKAEKDKWAKLFQHCLAAASKAEPAKKWLKEVTPIIESIGPDNYATQMQQWIALLKNQLLEIHKSKDYRVDFLRDDNHNTIKGLIWCAGLVNNNELNIALDDYAMVAYRKKPGVGPISARTGTAAMFAFSLLPIKEGVPRLSKFKSKIKNNTILKSINRMINDVASQNGLSNDEIEEITTPDYGVHNGRMIREFGEVKSVYDLSTEELLWDDGGKMKKSPPAAVKEKFATEIKALKNAIKELQATLPIINVRIEKSYLNQRVWNLKDWRERFIDHALMSVTARKLIWLFTKGDQKISAFWEVDKLVGADGAPVVWPDAETSVELWHPINADRDSIVRWREFLQQRKVTQPFKQAYREVYILTDAELRTDVYSNRFAAHVLRQHQFAALCKQRGWQYHLMGQWDSHNTPTLQLPLWNVVAEYYVDFAPDSTASEVGIYNYITTDQVRFTRDRQPIEMRNVPAMLFTEVMRDVDLFVGVTSIGNDPNWMDGGNTFQNGYWQEYSFGNLSESAEVRSQVLQNLIPRMKIAERCTFTKKFLVVRGDVRTYKIHMGSGNILMEPNDQYLCIVPGRSDRSGEKVFLPFEGDNLLSIIISKALLLADDKKITDKTILSQIGR